MMKNKKVKMNFFIPQILPNSKRGLSTVVTSLILILLVLVAVGIIWIVIMKIISSGTEQMSLGKLTMNLEIKKVEVHDAGIDVQVKRNTGAGELSGIKFIVSDGVDTQIFEMPTTMQELATKRFTLAYTGLVKKVSIAPIFETSSGKEFTGNEIDEFEFSNKEIIKNLGGISWWRFEGNAVDEIGGNDGEEFGGVNCNVKGKYGKACDFDGTGDYVTVPSATPFNFERTDSFSFSLWCKRNAYGGFLFKKSSGSYNTPGYGVYDFSGESQFRVYLSGTTVNNDLLKDFNYPQGYIDQEWELLVITYDGSVSYDGFLLYWNGIEVSGDNVRNTLSETTVTADPIIVGSTFNGTIDEPMIFNRALSEEQIKALYELDLS